MNFNEHIDAAERLKDTYDTIILIDDSFAFVALFYSSLHYVHAYLSSSPDIEDHHRHPDNHTNNSDKKLGTNPTVKKYLPDIYSDYFHLYRISRGIRYEGIIVKKSEYKGFEDRWDKIKISCGF